MIALVVTIVVLLILAGVSISMLTGESGIISQAQQAKQKTEEARIQEELNLQMQESYIEQFKEDSKLPAGLEQMGVVGMNKYVAYHNGVDEFHFVILKDGKYYNTVYTSKTNSFENIESVSSLKNEALILYWMFTGDLEKLTPLAEGWVQYNDNIYMYVENVMSDYFECYIEESKPIKMIVNSGDDGIVVLPISNVYSSNNVINIDWGDGNQLEIGENDENKILNATQVASLDGIQIADLPPIGFQHKYIEKNKEYEVTINGDISEMSSLGCKYYYKDEGGTDDYPDGPSKIIEITQWGNTGLEEINLSGCSNLRKIASPNKNSFINVESFENAFAACTSLTAIPTDLFDNCPNVESFEETFTYCTSLIEIPKDLFDNCPNVESYKYTFFGCSGLTGNAPELWKLGTNSEENDYVRKSKWKIMLRGVR